MIEELVTNIFLAILLRQESWKTINYLIKKKDRIKDIIEHRIREVLDLLIGITNMCQKNSLNNIKHHNTPVTCLGNGKFGDHY